MISIEKFRAYRPQEYKVSTKYSYDTELYYGYYETVDLKPGVSYLYGKETGAENMVSVYFGVLKVSFNPFNREEIKSIKEDAAVESNKVCQSLGLVNFLGENLELITSKIEDDFKVIERNNGKTIILDMNSLILSWYFVDIEANGCFLCVSFSIHDVERVAENCIEADFERSLLTD